MGAYAIFICHKCKVAERGPGKYKWTDIDKGPIEEAKSLFSCLHPGHDIAIESDAHGQFLPEEYDFERKCFYPEQEIKARFE